MRVTQQHRRPQRRRQLVEREPQERPLVLTFDARQGPGLGLGGGPHLARVDVARDRLAFLADAAVVVDAQIAADADQPGLEVRPPVERVQRLEDLDEDVLRQVLGLVVLAGELVGDVEDLAPVLPDHLAPGILIPRQAPLDERVNLRRGLGGVKRHGDGAGRMISGDSASSV
jgi:hypothetical protein